MKSPADFDLTRIADLKNLLKKYGLWAKKRLGQNFLIDRSALEAVITAADLKKSDRVVEIGPGPGVLTREILPRVAHLRAIEVDKSILPALRESTHFYRDKLDIENSHILNVTPPTGAYKIVANIPYQLTSPILRKFLVETKHRPTSITLMVQKEVCEKICDVKKKSLLSLFVEAFGDAEQIRLVRADSFFPVPKVDSAILHIRVLKTPRLTTNPHRFFSLAKTAFSQKRKKLKNTIPVEWISAADIDGNRRGENLTFEEWEALVRASDTSHS